MVNMSIFKKRETLTENITYMALMAAINVVFVLLTTLLPVLLFLLVFILPLTSTIVTIFCKKKYFIIYAVATTALCLLATIWDIGNTLFYVIPSIVSGFLFGLLLEKKVAPIWIIFIAIIAQVVLSYPAIPLIQLMYGRDIVKDFATVFGLASYPKLNYVKHMFICALAIIQQVLSFAVVNEEFPKLGINATEGKKGDLLVLIAIPSLIVISVIFAICYPELSYPFMFGTLFLAIYELVLLIVEKRKISIVLLIASSVISLFAFAALYNVVNSLSDRPVALLLIQIFPLFIAIIGFINNYLFISKKKDTIENRQEK